MLQAIGFRYVSYFQRYRITVFTSSNKNGFEYASCGMQLRLELTDTGLGAAFSGSSLAIHVLHAMKLPGKDPTERIRNITQFANAFYMKLHSSSCFI
jgi:hypothetical protein